MKIAFNKDLILKHKYWILLVLAVPLIITSICVLLFPISGAIAKQRKDLQGKVSSYQKVQPPFISAENIEQKNKEVKDSLKRENTTWQKVFGEQADSFTWPADFEAIYPFHNGKFVREVRYIEGETQAVPNDEHHFTGRIVDKNNYYLTLKGKDGKEEKFYRVNYLDMKLPMRDGRVETFFQLQIGKEAQITFQTARFFFDKLHDIEQADYTKYYGSQIRPILDLVEPVNEDGEGVVQLRDWLVPKNPRDLPPSGVKFLRAVQLPWKANHDISEEAWLAQENLWIQKEFYRLIRMANDYVGVMKPVKGLKSKEATCRNPYFELTLKLLDANKVQATIKNLRNHRQKLEVSFRVKFAEDAEFEKVFIEGEPLDPAGTADKDKNPKDTLTKTITLDGDPGRKGIFRVEQILTWETAAVRRIDQITIGSLGASNASGGGGLPTGSSFNLGGGSGIGDADIALNHRAFPDGLKPFKEEPKKEEPAAEGADKKMPGFGMMPVGASLTPNGLITNRYTEVTEQARRLPVGVVMIVDQDHIDRVVTAFSNSKYRFLLNQVLINRYPGSLRPAIFAKDDKSQIQPPVGPFGLPAGRGPGMMPPLGGAPEDEMESNVELVLYGTVTLYERYPPRRLPVAEAETPAP